MTAGTEATGSGKTQYQRNTQGYISQVTYADGQNVRYEFAANGRDVVAKHTPFGTTRYQYNAYSDITKMTNPQGQVTQWQYNAQGQVTQIEYPSGAIAEFVYNDQQQLVEEKLQGQTQTRYTYDAFGRLATETRHNSKTHQKGETSQKNDTYAHETYRYEYNGINSITKLTYPDGQVSTWEYGQCPRLLNQQQGRGGRSATYEYDANKWPTKVTRQNGEMRQFEWDANGNQSAIIDEIGRKTQWTYDAADKLTQKTYPDGSQVEYQYDPEQRLNKVTDARAISTQMAYDDLGRLHKLAFSDSTPEVQYHYNDQGLVARIVDAVGTHSFTFDEYGRITTHDGPWDNDTQSFHYNLLGQLHRLEVEGSDPQDFTYDVLGRLTKIQQGDRTYRYGYQGQSRQYHQLVYPNGLTETRTLGAMGKVEQVAYRSGVSKNSDTVSENSNTVSKNTNTIAATAFEYNARDLIVREDIQPAAPLTYDYQEQQVGEYSNALNQLTETLTKDLQGNTQKTQSYAYDLAGNQTQGYTQDGHPFRATYNALSQLTRLQWEQDGKQHQKEYRYYYTRFLAEVAYSVDDKKVRTTRFVRRGVLTLQERDQNNQVQRHLLWGKHSGGGIGGLLGLKQGDQDYQYLYDGKGNVIAVVNADNSNAVAAAYDYSPYGVLVGSAGDPTFKQPYQYSTKRQDPETGLIDFGYRFYLPNEGRSKRTLVSWGVQLLFAY